MQASHSPTASPSPPLGIWTEPRLFLHTDHGSDWSSNWIRSALTLWWQPGAGQPTHFHPNLHRPCPQQGQSQPPAPRVPAASSVLLPWPQLPTTLASPRARRLPVCLTRALGVEQYAGPAAQWHGRQDHPLPGWHCPASTAQGWHHQCPSRDPNPSTGGQCLCPFSAQSQQCKASDTHLTHCHTQSPPLTHDSPLSHVLLMPSPRPLELVMGLLPKVPLAPTPQAAAELGVCQDSTALGTVSRPQAEARILSDKGWGPLTGALLDASNPPTPSLAAYPVPVAHTPRSSCPETCKGKPGSLQPCSSHWTTMTPLQSPGQPDLVPQGTATTPTVHSCGTSPGGPGAP